jgi:RNA polymerase sigma-70 factor, ECF subfamily
MKGNIDSSGRAFQSKYMAENPKDLTDLLIDWRKGNQEAGKELIQAVYDRLHRMAAYYLRQERDGHTLEATALVNELYLKMFSSKPVQWQDRAHFFAVAAQQLRRILVDRARAARAGKRGGDCLKVSITAAKSLPFPTDILDIDEALRSLESLDPRAAAGVELRFFAGLTETEIAEALGISLATLHRDWKIARAWLLSQLNAAD